MTGRQATRSGSGSRRRPSDWMPDRTPEGRGRRLLGALNRWLEADRALKCGINRFEVRVAEDGDTWIERLRW